MIIDFSNNYNSQGIKLVPDNVTWIWQSAPLDIQVVVGQGYFTSKISTNDSFTSNVSQLGYFTSELKDLEDI